MLLVKYGFFFRQAGSSLARRLRSFAFLKGTLHVQRSTTDWAVLRGCGHEPLQFYRFRSAVKLFNSMLNTNSDTLQRVVQADLNIQPLFFFFFGGGCYTVSRHLNKAVN